MASYFKDNQYRGGVDFQSLIVSECLESTSKQTATKQKETWKELKIIYISYY